MIRHLLISLVSAILMMAAVICTIFVILQFTPGDPVQAIVGEHSVPPALRAALEERYHLNDPMPLRLYYYFANLLHGDLGSSFGTQVPVLKLLAERAPRTIALASAGFLLAILVGAALGISAGISRSRFTGVMLNATAIVGYSIPTFWLGQILVIVFAVRLGWFPTQGMSPMFSRAQGLGVALERLPYIVLPMVTYAIHEGARVARLIRASVLDTLHQSFITTARMKGLSEAEIVRGHILRNSILPVVVVMGYAFGAAMGGTILIETVFSWPGVGLLLVDAIRARDNQVVVGVVLFVAAAIVLMNIIVDLLYMWLDPRVRAG